MKILPVIIVVLHLSLLAIGAVAYWEDHDRIGQYFFGYTGVESDLPRYFGEIQNNRIPTNVVSLNVNAASDDLAPKITYLVSHAQKAIIVLDNLLYINDPGLSTKCGSNAYRHRRDFMIKFDNWLALNRTLINAQKVTALVVNTEVNNRCISPESLDQVTRYLKSRVPDVSVIAIYDTSLGAKDLPETIPTSLAGVGFFKYRVLDPRTDPTYQDEFAMLKSKLTPEQRIILIADGFYDSAHRALGWSKWHLGYVALNYMDIALTDPKVVGLVIFTWKGFDEGGEFKLGTRDLPQSVRDRQKLVGCGLKIESIHSVDCAD